VYGYPPYLVLTIRAVDCTDLQKYGFEKFLLSALYSDMPSYATGHVDGVLAQVAQVEAGSLDEYQYEGDGFVHHITRQRVRFEHSVFGECPEWPIWCCTLAQYKAALLGYRRFLDMPKSTDSELTIDLPDGEPEDC
jgi:hypothetical protein